MGVSVFLIPATPFNPAFTLFDPSNGINPASVPNYGIGSNGQIQPVTLPSSNQLANEVQSLASGANVTLAGVTSPYAQLFGAIQAGNASVAPNTSVNVDGILLTADSLGKVSVSVGQPGSQNFISGTPAGADAFTLSTASAISGLDKVASTTLLSSLPSSKTPLASASPLPQAEPPSILNLLTLKSSFQKTPAENAFSTPTLPTISATAVVVPKSVVAPEVSPVAQVQPNAFVPENLPVQNPFQEAINPVSPVAIPSQTSADVLKAAAEAQQPQRILEARMASMPALPSFPSATPPAATYQQQESSTQLNLGAQGNSQAFSKNQSSFMGFSAGSFGSGGGFFGGKKFKS